MDIAFLQHEAWKTAQAKGHHAALVHLDQRSATLVRLALIHTEVSEATQEVKRHGVDDAIVRKRIVCELADVLVRCAELAALLGEDLDAAVIAVLAKNEQRPYQYGTPGEQTCPSPCLTS